MTRSEVLGRALRTSLAVGLGGALGAAARAGVADVAQAAGVAGWLATAVTNIVGGLAIGSVFVHLEARYRAHDRSRLAELPHGSRIHGRGWSLEADETLDPVDLFRADASIRLWSGFLVTGVLGGFTTFSTFAVGMAALRGETGPVAFTASLAFAALSPMLAAAWGLRLGEWTLPHRGRREG